jgi:hypothetical protein
VGRSAARSAEAENGMDLIAMQSGRRMEETGTRMLERMFRLASISRRKKEDSNEAKI